jgi:hypothetical protein
MVVLFCGSRGRVRYHRVRGWMLGWVKDVGSCESNIRLWTVSMTVALILSLRLDTRGDVSSLSVDSRNEVCVL